MKQFKAIFQPVISVEDEPATLDALQQIQRNWDELSPLQQSGLMRKSNDMVNQNRRGNMIRKASQAALKRATEEEIL